MLMSEMQNPGDTRVPEGFEPIQRPHVLILPDGATIENPTNGAEVVRLQGSPSIEADETTAREATTLYGQDTN